MQRIIDNLQNFLRACCALATSIDQEWKGAKVNLMTMHAAKGLEFDVSFFTWMGRRIIPSSKINLEEKGDFALEEERRLAYVGITRAKKELLIYHSL